MTSDGWLATRRAGCVVAGLLATALGLAAIGAGLLAVAGGTAVYAALLLPGAVLVPVGWYGVVTGLSSPGTSLDSSDTYGE